MGRTYNCWMLNCWCITWPVGFKRLISALDIEATGSFETSANSYQTTLCHLPASGKSLVWEPRACVPSCCSIAELNTDVLGGFSLTNELTNMERNLCQRAKIFTDTKQITHKVLHSSQFRARLVHTTYTVPVWTITEASYHLLLRLGLPSCLFPSPLLTKTSYSLFFLFLIHFTCLFLRLLPNLTILILFTEYCKFHFA